MLRKHLATFTALALALAFVLLFFHGRRESTPLPVVAMRVGLSTDALIAMVPRISSQTGATLGTSRRVIYLMACSGVPHGADFEAQARRAADIAEKERVTPREAATSVLSAIGSPARGADSLRDC